MTGPGYADLPTLTRRTQETEAATGLVDMTAVRMAKLFQSQPTRRAHAVRGTDRGAAGWVAVRVDGCTGVLTADQCVFEGASVAARARAADELVELASRMAVEVATAVGTAAPVTLRFEVPRSDAVVGQALQEHGAGVVDTLARLRADIREVLRNSPKTPGNVEIRRVETEDDLAAHHRIRNIGYAELPDDRPLTVGQWRDQLLDEPGSSPDAWLLAMVDGEPAGMLVASLSRAELGAVYIAHAATLPEARGSLCNYALNRVALSWGLRKGLSWSRCRCRADETLGVGIGEVNSRGYLVVDYLDIWEVRIA